MHKYIIKNFDNKLYWSNELGWTDIKNATVFTWLERKEFNLPEGDCGWVRIH